MNRICIDALCKQVTDGSCISLLRISSANQLTEVFDCVVFLQNGRVNRAAGHETNQIVEERTLSVDTIEITGALIAELGVFQGNDFEAGLSDLI